MQETAIKKAEVFSINDILEYEPQSIVIKSILRKTTGNLSAVSFDSGEVLMGKPSPFDTFIQIIDGIAEVIIDDDSNLLEMGQSIIIPAHSTNAIKACKRFKMLSTVIKHGYDDIIL